MQYGVRQEFSRYCVCHIELYSADGYSCHGHHWRVDVRLSMQRGLHQSQQSNIYIGMRSLSSGHLFHLRQYRLHFVRNQLLRKQHGQFDLFVLRRASSNHLRSVSLRLWRNKHRFGTAMLEFIMRCIRSVHYKSNI